MIIAGRYVKEIRIKAKRNGKFTWVIFGGADLSPDTPNDLRVEGRFERANPKEAFEDLLEHFGLEVISIDSEHAGLAKLWTADENGKFGDVEE